MLEVPPDLFAERRRCGADRSDEMWHGVLHMHLRWHDGSAALSG